MTTADVKEPVPWDAKDAQERVCPACGCIVFFFDHNREEETITLAHGTPVCAWFTEWSRENRKGRLL